MPIAAVFGDDGTTTTKPLRKRELRGDAKSDVSCTFRMT